MSKNYPFISEGTAKVIIIFKPANFFLKNFKNFYAEAVSVFFAIFLILNIKRGNQALHSVYVYKVTRSSVYLYDSDLGKMRMPFEKFIAQWDGTGLMVRCNTVVENVVEPVRIPIKHNVFGKIFQILSAICFVVGIFFIDDEINVLIPILCIVGGVGLEIITKALQLKDMRRFDFESMKLLQNVKAKNYSEFLPRREKLKMSAFSGKNNFLFYLLSCLFVIFVVLLNNPYNIACIFMPIFLAIMQSLVIAPLEKKRYFEIEQMEVKFSKEKTSVSAGTTLRKIEDESYKFSYSILGKKALGIILLFISSFVTLVFQNAFDLINIFFLAYTEIFLYQNLLPLFSYESSLVEEKLNYMRFINILQ